MATCVHPSWLSQSSKCSKSSVIVEKVRTSFRPAFSRHATSILACTSIPQQHAYNTSMLLSFRSLRESLHSKESAMRARSNSWWCLAGSRVRLTHGLAAPRRLDLWSAVTTTNVSFHFSFFIRGGDAPRHDG